MDKETPQPNDTSSNKQDGTNLQLNKKSPSSNNDIEAIGPTPTRLLASSNIPKVRRVFRSLVQNPVYIIAIGMILLFAYPLWSNILFGSSNWIMQYSNQLGDSGYINPYFLASEIVGVVLLVIYVLTLIGSGKVRKGALSVKRHRAYQLLVICGLLLAIIGPVTITVLNDKSVNDYCVDALPNPSQPGHTYCLSG